MAPLARGAGAWGRQRSGDGNGTGAARLLSSRDKEPSPQWRLDLMSRQYLYPAQQPAEMLPGDGLARLACGTRQRSSR